MQSIKILGTTIHNVTYQETLDQIDKLLTDQQIHYLVTPNPEIVLYALKHADFQKILNQAAISLPDGIGLLFAAKLKKLKLKQRVTGTDLLYQLLNQRQPNYNFFLLGGKNNVNLKISHRFPQAKIISYDNGGVISDQGIGKYDQLVIKKINDSRANILIVAFGHPKQERWIHNNSSRLTSVKVILACGGALDYLAGETKRAPRWLRSIGLEWLYRFIQEPQRIKRIIRATIIFSYKVLLAKKIN